MNDTRGRRRQWVVVAAVLAGCGGSSSVVGGDGGANDTDLGASDVGPADTGPADSGAMDTGPADTGPADSGAMDTGPADTGDPDAATPADALTCPSGQQVCDARCVDVHCAAGFADCDGNATNGCETDTRTSATHCGGCGNALRARQRHGGLRAGRLHRGDVRNAGFGDCDGNAANGCEADTRTSVSTAAPAGRCTAT
jgi:hypothetical protein